MQLYLHHLLLISQLITYLFSLEFRLQESILEVRDARSGLFHPLCEASFRRQYAEIACQQDSGKYDTSSVVPLNESTQSVACGQKPNGLRHCFSYISAYCTKGVRVNCQIKYCNKESVELGDKCVFISAQEYNGYNAAKTACDSQRALSISNLNDRNKLIQLIAKDFDSTRLYFTSGIRKGSIWVWEDDGHNIQFPIEGSGRCLGVRNGTWSGVDCGERGAIICESGRDCLEGSRYEGSHNHTQIGLPCMKWNDPSVLFYGNVTSRQGEWNHNLCRIVATSEQPSCFVSPSSLQPCSVPLCPGSPSNLEQKADLSSICETGYFQCGDSVQCVADEFRCDYEFDCKNGKDEENCPEYLLSFELIGAYKLAAKVTEIWTFIPQVQATCLLTDSTEITSSILAPRIYSQFYKRRFSSRDVQFKLMSMVLQARKDEEWHAVCDEGYSVDFASDVCHIAGYGRSPRSLSSLNLLTNVTNFKGWRISCLRDAACNSTQLHECNPLRCSTCAEDVCSDGVCLERNQLCDGRRDCKAGDDETDCNDISFRLVNGNEISGNVEVFFHGQWQPLCQHTFDADKICSSMKMGLPAIMLKPTRAASSVGWTVACNETCFLTGLNSCSEQARIRCNGKAVDESSKCGIRRVPVAARDPWKTRFARIVGGFETVAGAFPWTAAIRIKTTKAHHCGASILDRTHLITAAHCFEEDKRPQSYDVVVGDYDNNATEVSEQIFNVTLFHFYPLYEDLFAHDIAIVEISRPGLEWTDFVQPVCLPPREFNYNAGRFCVVSGWGSMGLRYPQRLQAALIPIIDRKQCMNASRIYQSMSRSAFCAGYLEGGIDSCQGDSGGPLACQREDGAYVLAGVISWGDGCAQKNQPGIYTMVAPYISWIQTILET